MPMDVPVFTLGCMRIILTIIELWAASSNGEGAIEYYLYGLSSDLFLFTTELNPLSTFSVESWDELGVTESFGNDVNQHQQISTILSVLGMDPNVVGSSDRGEILGMCLSKFRITMEIFLGNSWTTHPLVYDEVYRVVKRLERECGLILATPCTMSIITISDTLLWPVKFSGCSISLEAVCH